MDLQALRDLTVQHNLIVHGVPATVTVPGGSPVSTRLIWIRRTVESPMGSGAQIVEARRGAAMPKADVPAVPRGTVVQAAERPGGVVQTWKVDGVDQLDEPELHRVVLVPA